MAAAALAGPLAWVGWVRLRRERAERLARSLADSETRFRLLWEAATDAVIVADGKGFIQYANPAVEALFGYLPRDAAGMELRRLLRNGGNDEGRLYETTAVHRSGREFPVEVSCNRLERGGRETFAAFVRDISERRQTQDLLTGQAHALEMLATGRPLAEVLHAITQWVEGGFPGLLCTILLLDETGARVHCAAVSSMPPEYNAAIEGLAIGPQAGSCGTAAWRKQMVVVSDIATDPLWAPYRHLALPHRLLACWSMPILASDGAVLGTLAMYYREKRKPGPREMETIRASAAIAGIAIERTRHVERLRRSDERFDLVARATNELVWDWNLLTDEIWWNDIYTAQLGYAPEEVKPGIESWKDFIHPDDRERVLSEVDAVIAGAGHSWSGEYRFRRRDGSYAVLFDRGFVVRDAAGRGLRMIGAAMDISERKRAEEQLAQLAQFDPLSGLPNRSLFKDRLAQAISRAHREGWSTGLLFVDLDRFKEINDSHGHAAGDEVLKTVAARLRGCMREGDTVARLGGDEFTVILEDVRTRDNAAGVAQKILDVLGQPVKAGGGEFFVTGSIGIALHPDDGADADTLVKHADTAMYYAKAEGRNTARHYAPGMSSAASERMSLEGGLRLALERGELVLHYQPIVEIKSGAVVAAEALLRWQHPERGLVQPLDFIPIAEQSGLIVPIGEWVLREACAQAMRWRAQGLRLRMSVNLSPRQYRKGGLADTVAAALEGSGLEGDGLVLELTESLLMENPDGSRKLLADLKAMGVRVKLDDFGTGYSSLVYLRQFPLDGLKIDRSFMRGLALGAEDASIVKAMIGLAHSLQLTLTAEGVETAAQLAFLREHGCDHAQGYFFGRPVEAALFTQSPGA